MNQLMKLLLWEYSYEMSIRSITPEEVKKLGYHADYILKTRITTQRSNIQKNKWRYYDHLWEYAVTIYG